jgi:enoyl-CoA hydratase/carnithine racemase
VTLVTIDRPEVANAIDAPTALELADAFRRFDADGSASIAVLTGANGTFCAGADPKAMRSGEPERVTRVAPDGDGRVGPTRMLLHWQGHLPRPALFEVARTKREVRHREGFRKVTLRLLTWPRTVK